MIISIIIGFSAFLLAVLYDRKVLDWGLLASLAVLTIFCAIRWNWGNDMPSYANFFESVGSENIKFWQLNKILNLDIYGYERSSEVGWTILNILCQPIGFFGLTIVTSVFEGIVVYWFINKYVPRGYTALSVFLYAFNPYLMVLGCSMMRQWFAICIVLIAVSFLEKKKFVKFVLIVYLASLFHTSALFCLIFYLFYKVRNKSLNIHNAYILFILAMLWLYVSGRYLSSILQFLFSINVFEIYQGYIKSTIDSSGIGLGAFMNLIVIFICLLSIRKAKAEIKLFTWIYSGSLIVQPFVIIAPMTGRIVFYFDILAISVIPNCFILIKKPILKKFVLFWLFVWNLYLYYNFFNSKVWQVYYMEYHSMFEAPYWM